jgi:ParB family chromosome partitioning protein
MARIKEVKELPLKDLVIGKGQVRTRDVNKDIKELAESISKVGLLEPIVVCPAESPGKYEVITGQRRFLAHQELKKETILAAILDEKVDETTAKVLSVTENLVRRDLNRRDLIDVCNVLFKKYGTMTDVAAETGLPYAKVKDYVKYDRLKPELRQLVDKGEVDIKPALRAQDAASVGGKYNAQEAVKLAKEMSRMSGVQQSKLAQQIQENPTASKDELIEAAKTGGKIIQINVQLGAGAHQALVTYAKVDGTTLDDAARGLIEDGLISKGFLEEEEVPEEGPEEEEKVEE